MQWTLGKYWLVQMHLLHKFYRRPWVCTYLKGGVSFLRWLYLVVFCCRRCKSPKASILLNTLTRARAVKHEEGGVFLLSPEPNPIMLATILMQMTTASTVLWRPAAAVLRTSLCGAMPACVRYEECLVCVIHNKIWSFNQFCSRIFNCSVAFY